MYFIITMPGTAKITSCQFLLLLALNLHVEGEPATPEIPGAADAPVDVTVDTISREGAASSVALSPGDSAGRGPSGHADTDSVRTAEAPDTAETSGTAVVDGDTIEIDTVLRAYLRDSILLLQARPVEAFLAHPLNPDTLFSPWRVYPSTIYGADAPGLAEILRSHPFYQYIPYTMTSQLNRTLYLGYPAALTSIAGGGGLTRRFPHQLAGTDWLTASATGCLTHSGPGRLRYVMEPGPVESPEMVLLWEGGVGALFGENVLDLRFARPLADALSVGVFSTYRNFLRRDFNHASGGMGPMYEAIYERLGHDTTYWSDNGRNPLTREHVVAGSLSWGRPAGTTGRIAYQYGDLRNDQSFQYMDTSGARLGWEEIDRYEHDMDLTLGGLRVGPVAFTGEAFFRSGINRTIPLVRAAKFRGAQRGERIAFGGGIEAMLPLAAADTLLLSVLSDRERRVRYSDDPAFVDRLVPRVSYRHANRWTNVGVAVGGDAGCALVELDDSLEAALLWNVDGALTFAGQTLKAFARQDLAPAVVPFDTSFMVSRGAFLDRYGSYGVETRLAWNLVGLSAAYCFVHGIYDSATGGVGRSVAFDWPGGIAPYRQPQSVVSICPFLGPWHGLSLSTRWMFADERPHVRSSSVLSLRTGSKVRHHYLDMDLMFDYWSIRDSIAYGGIDYWHRAIYDLGLKTTVRIKTFRLFYRMDNIFNRQIAYVPGYFLPGLVFRWGFNWLIPG